MQHIVSALASIRRHFIGGYRTRNTRIGINLNGKRVAGRSKYTPHQGAQEKIRRRRQIAARME